MNSTSAHEILCPDGISRSALYRHKERADADASAASSAGRCGGVDEQDTPCPGGAHKVITRGITDLREVMCSMCGGSCLHEISSGISELRGVIDLNVTGGYGQSFPQDGEGWTLNFCESCFGAIAMICKYVKKFDHISALAPEDIDDCGAVAILRGQPAWRYPHSAFDAEKARRAMSDMSSKLNRFLSELREKEIAMECSKSNIGAAVLYSKYSRDPCFVEVEDGGDEIRLYCHWKPSDAPDDINGVPIKYLVG